MDNEFLNFVGKIGAMKPATIDDENDKQVDRLHKLF